MYHHGQPHRLQRLCGPVIALLPACHGPVGELKKQRLAMPEAVAAQLQLTPAPR